ncbi:MAG: R3H domain-containing nucleic acid-binding protein, partial [Patescibacteria group bacterium]
AKLALKKIDPASIENLVLDMNNYRREREHLISELAKAAARKVLMNKQEVQLPAMNAYERRIVHMELASRPDVKTESSGLGPERHIIVKPI